jgi:Transposase
VQLADRWHTCFYDLSGNQGMLGQAEGRIADDAAYWLAGATPAWRNAVQVVAIDMFTIYLSAVKRMLPGARVAVDLFHVVQLAVKTMNDMRRRAIREKYGRRGRAGDPEYGIKHLLERNLENLSPDNFAKIIETLDGDRDGQQIALACRSRRNPSRTRSTSPGGARQRRLGNRAVLGRCHRPRDPDSPRDLAVGQHWQAARDQGEPGPVRERRDRRGIHLDRGIEIVGRHADGGGRVRLANRCPQAYQRGAVHPAHLPEHAGLIDGHDGNAQPAGRGRGHGRVHQSP